ncbi:MAG: GH3 auxin-responsive promoter family protein [Bacteroidota bacterium]
MKQRIHQIELFIKYPCEVQDDWFKKLIESGRFSEWGRVHDYAGISNLSDFRNRVPIQDYESLKPWINRLRAGEQRLLWNTETKWFA